MTQKFSQFLDGLMPRTTDIVVGLRDYPNNPLNERFDFSGVADEDGNTIVTWSSAGALAVNYVDIANSLTTFGPTVTAKGDDAVININIGGKGDSSYAQFLGTRAIAVPTGTTAEEGGAVIGGLRYNLDTDYLRYWDIGANAWVDIIAGAAYDNATFITKTDETATLPNSVPLSGLATGFLSNTTATGVLNPRSLTSASSQRIVITNPTGLAGDPAFDLATTAVTPGSYTIADITVDAYGRITAAADGTVGSATDIGIIITQAAHGFGVGDILYLSGTTYALAQANSTITAEVVGVVGEVFSVDSFLLVTVGRISGLAGLTPGAVYWLSDATPGLATLTIPTTTLNITKPVWIADSTTTAFVYQERGKIIPESSFPGFGFNTVVGDTTVEPGNGYITNGVGVITYTIPADAVATDYYVISGGTNTTPWVVQMNTGQTLQVGTQTTSSGGTLTADDAGDAVHIVCTGTNTFRAYSVLGNPITA